MGTLSDDFEILSEKEKRGNLTQLFHDCLGACILFKLRNLQ